MSRTIFSRFNVIEILSSIPSGFVSGLRVCVFGFLCFGLSACVEGVDLPEFITSMQIIPEASKTDEPEVREQPEVKQSHSDYEREPTLVDSKALLAAKGNWNIVEQGGAMDPTQAHLQARESVNVRRRRTKDELSPQFQLGAKSGEDGKMRVLRLQRDGRSFDGDTRQYDLAESSVVKPSHTVAESDLLQKIKALFGEEDAGSKSLSEASGVAVPERKPDQVSSSAVDVKQDQAHKIGGVVVPPALPVRKVTEVHKEKAVAGEIVRPRVKPNVSAYEIVQEAMSKKEQVKAVKLRSGRHKGKTRLVIEVTEPAKYKVAIDHVRNVLRVRLENTHWALPLQDRFDNSALLGTYIAREQGDGSVLFEVRLEKQTKIIDATLMRPSLSSRHRFVIDLAE